MTTKPVQTSRGKIAAKLTAPTDKKAQLASEDKSE